MRCAPLVLVALVAAVNVVAGCSQERSEPETLIALAKSFTSDAQLSRQRQQPIVVLVSRRGCPYCATLRKKVLHPMARAGEIETRMILRELSLDEGFEVVDFDGRIITGRHFAERYDASVTPTLLFLDAHGAEVANRRVGLSNIEYYPHYLNNSLETATAKIAAVSQAASG